MKKNYKIFNVMIVLCLVSFLVGCDVLDSLWGTSDGTSSSDTSDSNISKPTVSTLSYSNLTDTSVVLKGKIVSTGGGNPYRAGICCEDITIDESLGCFYKSGTFNVGYTFEIKSFDNLISGHQYKYRAYAVNSAGTSYGGYKYFTTPSSTEISVPTGVTASDGTYTDKVYITWNSVSGASYYKLYRATSSGGTKTAITSWQSSRYYYDYDVIPGDWYYYFVKAATSSSEANASGYSLYNIGYAKIVTQQYTLTTEVTPYGTGYVTPSSGTYDEGTEITVFAQPYSDYNFDYWSGDYIGNSCLPSTTITMYSDKFLTAHFIAKLKAYTDAYYNLTNTSVDIYGIIENNGSHNAHTIGWYVEEIYTGEVDSVFDYGDFGPGGYMAEGYDLKPNTPYRYRFYAENDEDSSYGDWEYFTTYNY
jgi:hypothetical protein